MKKKLRTSTLSVVLVLTLVGVVFAQTWNLPDSRRNTRFTTDLHDIVRPALTIRGFDNSDLPTRAETVYYIFLNNKTVITPKICR